MKPYRNHIRERAMMQQLKDILLKEDREELLKLKANMDDSEWLSERITPIINQRLQFLKEHFPLEFRLEIEKIIDGKLKASQEEILNVIYPVMGRMIKKYIAHQFELLQEKIDAQLQSGWIGRARRLFSGVKESDMIINNLYHPFVEEIFVIYKHSGILIGSASLNETVDKDVVAGMLTAIKSFVEDAFRREKEELEMVSYGSYSIVLHNLHTYYIAIAMTGKLSNSQQAEFNTEVLEFAEKELNPIVGRLDDSSHYKIKEKLEAHFINTSP